MSSDYERSLAKIGSLNESLKNLNKTMKRISAKQKDILTLLCLAFVTMGIVLLLLSVIA